MGVFIRCENGLVFYSPPLFTFKERKLIHMKKILFALVAAATMLAMTGCCSMRTPTEGPNNGKVYYQTFMGLSIESAVYGDGFQVK